jgi:hypothetical protein
MTGEKTMDKIKKTDIETASPINLDPAQLEELDKLIDNLKKEIVSPQPKKRQESGALN